MASKKSSKRAYKVKKTKLKEFASAFGPAAGPFEIELKEGHGELVEVELELDRKLCRKHEVSLPSVRVFHWDAKAERFRQVPGSGINDRWTGARARIDASGIYVLAGASSNPWVGHAVATLRMFRPLLHDGDIGPILRHRLCPLILCPNMLGEIFDEIGDPSQHGMPPLPPGGLCDICMGGNIGHGVDLYPEPEPRRPPCVACNLSSYLDCNPTVRTSIVWRNPGVLRYDDWSADQKADLAAAFDTIRTGGEVGLPETAPATAPAPGELETVMSEEDAWDAYIAHLAHSLVVDSCDWVPWSISSLNDEERRLLLDSDAMFAATGGSYHMLAWPNGRASHGDPTRVYNWLRAEGLVASDHRDTVGLLLEWCRDNMAHYLFGADPDNMFDHWQYRGFPPVERIISGTTSSHATHHWTAGCWGTSGFLRLVLRTVNIPSTMVTNCGHSQPYFPTLDAYLSHGDDPYNRNTRDAGAAGVDMLVDQETFDEWFGEDVPDRCDNIGRRAREFAEE